MGIRVSWSCFVLHFVLVFFFFCCVGASTVVVGNKTDRVALLGFKSKITNDPFGALASWNKSIHFCQWHGVTCSRRHQRITILNLMSLKLAGSISPYIGNLSFLKVLNLENNSFTHEIPSEIGHLRRLEVLYLNNNSIGGQIPANISHCSKLTALALAFNQLVGKIPSEFGSLSKMENLFLSSNLLTGNMPSSLGNLSSIREIYLTDNNLNGSIPDTFCYLKNLANFTLALNMLSGTIPSSIFNISSIRIFDVGGNQIQGEIPLDMGFTLPNLQYFRVFINQVTGVIPPSISNASKLEVFQAAKNKLTGEVPYLEKLQRLSKFSVSFNSLGSGGHRDLNFLCSLTNSTSLHILVINGNNFGGLIPGCISNFSTTLTVLRLDSNRIFGSIPIGIGKFSNLQRLDMCDNQLSGTIPTTIGELQNLMLLRLLENRLSGSIPPSIGNLKKLLTLNLRDNSLQGSIPINLGQCQSLLEIDLSNNNLSGTIPPQVIGLSSLSIALDFSRNQLIGPLPTGVGNLKNIGILNVSRNMLEGEIPSTLGSCISLEELDMQGNLFQGPIPSTLSSLRALRLLDLSQNNLSGEIPVFLVGLKLVENLNLSHNKLEGEVPTEGVFKNASVASILGNNKLCGGIPEFHLRACVSKKSKQVRLTLPLKLVISIVSGLIGLVLALSFLFLCWVKRRKEKQNPNSSINSSLNLSYQKLYNATDGFSSTNLIGAGSFGSVYKGILDEGLTVAVKIFNLLHHEASKSFIVECKALRNIRHRNLIKILTACSGVDYQGNDFKALVFEFMHNGSLDEWLHPVVREDKTYETPRSLNLLQRLNIAIDVACAVSYLHNDCRPSTAHCDLKPNNVLIDDEMTAHVCDFGLARFLPPAHRQTSSIGVKGSIGYIAPEYGLGSETSTNGDVYSYGILLLELVTRKKPTDNMFEGDMNIHNFARTAIPDHVMAVVDPILLNDDEDLAIIDNQRQKQARINNKIKCLITMMRIGVACSMELPQDRMNITNVVHELQSIKKTFFEPKTIFNMQRGQHS